MRCIPQGRAQESFCLWSAYGLRQAQLYLRCTRYSGKYSRQRSLWPLVRWYLPALSRTQNCCCWQCLQNTLDLQKNLWKRQDSDLCLYTSQNQRRQSSLVYLCVRWILWRCDLLGIQSATLLYHKPCRLPGIQESFLFVQCVFHKGNVHTKRQVWKDGHKAHLAALCRDDRRCAAYTTVPGHLQVKTTEDRASVCRCKRKARYALYAVQRLGSGYQLGEA